MKTKFFSAAIFAVLFTALVVTQVTKVKAADLMNSPLTSPISYMLRGYVTYSGPGESPSYPAPNVRISIANSTNAKSNYVVFTDKMGAYSIALPVGTYQVTPSDVYNTRFNPSTLLINVYGNVEANFDGIHINQTSAVTSNNLKK